MILRVLRAVQRLVQFVRAHSLQFAFQLPAVLPIIRFITRLRLAPILAHKLANLRCQFLFSATRVNPRDHSRRTNATAAIPSLRWFKRLSQQEPEL